MGSPHRRVLACLAVLACLPAAPAAAQTAALRDDGGVVVNRDGLVAAFEPDGAVDTGFGPDGALRHKDAGPVATAPAGGVRLASSYITRCNQSGTMCDHGTDLHHHGADGGFEYATHLGGGYEEAYPAFARSGDGLLALLSYPAYEGFSPLLRLDAAGKQVDLAEEHWGAVAVRAMGAGALLVGLDAVYRYDADLDPVAGFGENGRVALPFDVVDAAPDGDHVAVLGREGDAHVVVRLRADGSRDPDFGDGGVATLSGVPDYRRVVADAGGGLLVGGDAAGDFRVIRLLGSGDPDGGYGQGGAAVADLGGADAFEELLPLPGGGAIATGTSTAGEDVRIALVRLTAGGDPAAGFGDEGKVVATFDTARPEVVVEDGPEHKETVDGESIRFDVSTPEDDVTLECQFDDGEWFACEDAFVREEQPHGVYRWRIRATDPLGNRTQSLHEFYVAPESAVTGGPPASTRARSATFAFEMTSDGEGFPSFSCRLDGGAWTECASPHTTVPLVDGEHTLEVRAEVSGVFWRASELEPERRTWRVDTRQPNTTVTVAPATTRSGDATVPFEVDEAGTRSECRLDAGEWKECSSPAIYSGLPVGPHTLAVRSTDEAGNVEETPAEVRWEVVDPPAPCCAPPIRPEPEPKPEPPVGGPPTLEQQRAAARKGLTLQARRAGRLRRAKAVAVDVGTAVEATVRVTGSIRMAGRRRAIALRAFGGRVQAGRSVRARLGLSKAARVLLRRRGGPRTVVVRLKVALARPDGVALTTRTVRVRLRR